MSTANSFLCWESLKNVCKFYPSKQFKCQYKPTEQILKHILKGCKMGNLFGALRQNRQRGFVDEFRYILLDYTKYYMYFHCKPSLYLNANVSNRSNLNKISAAARKLVNTVEIHFKRTAVPSQILNELMAGKLGNRRYRECLDQIWTTKPSWEGILEIVKFCAWMCMFCRDKSHQMEFTSFFIYITVQFFERYICSWIMRSPKGWKNLVDMAKRLGEQPPGSSICLPSSNFFISGNSQ